jgi:hypothetical protein
MTLPGIAFLLLILYTALQPGPANVDQAPRTIRVPFLLAIWPFAAVLAVILCVRELRRPRPVLNTTPRLDEETMRRIAMHVQALFGRLNNGEELWTVANDVAQLSGATPGQVVLFVHAARQPKSGGRD